MIRSHFGLTRNPFDPETLTLLAQQQEIFDILRVSSPIGGKTMTHRSPDRPNWSNEQIRAARMVALPPLLEKRGLALRDRGGGNLEVVHYQGLLIKASYWRWPERDLAGNAIDFYVKVLGTSFNDAMKQLTEG